MVKATHPTKILAIASESFLLGGAAEMSLGSEIREANVTKG